MPLHNRILLPEEIAPGRIWLPTLGMCDVDLLPGGWLVRLAIPAASDEATVASASLDLRNPDAPVLEMRGDFGRWRHDISLRHAEILLILARHGAGRSAPELADDLYGDRTRVVTVRAEVSRLRKQFAGLLAAQPYRFAGSVDIAVAYPEDMSMLLPSSTAPAVRMARSHHQQQGSQ
jgi:hypothetical protein